MIVARFFVAASAIDGTRPDITRVANVIRTDNATQIAIGHILLQTLCGFPTQAHCPKKSFCLPMRNAKKKHGPNMTEKKIQGVGG